MTSYFNTGQKFGICLFVCIYIFIVYTVCLYIPYLSGSPQRNEQPTYRAFVLCSECPSSCNPALGNTHALSHLQTLIHYGHIRFLSSPIAHAFGVFSSLTLLNILDSQGMCSWSTQRHLSVKAQNRNAFGKSQNRFAVH